LVLYIDRLQLNWLHRCHCVVSAGASNRLAAIELAAIELAASLPLRCRCWCFISIGCYWAASLSLRCRCAVAALPLLVL
jgi:hypothetical protein